MIERTEFEKLGPVTKKRAAVLTVALIILTVTVFLVRRAGARRRFERNIPLIRAGMTEPQATALLGRNYEMHRPCWGADPRCKFEYMYPMPSEFLGFWSISFDENGQVIDKEGWYSP